MATGCNLNKKKTARLRQPFLKKYVYLVGRIKLKFINTYS